MLVFQNNETAAMLVFQTNPVGVELFSYVSENALWEIEHRCKQKPSDHFKLRWFQQNKMRMTQMPRLFLQSQLAMIEFGRR